MVNDVYSKDNDVLGTGLDGFAHIGQARAQIDF